MQQATYVIDEKITLEQYKFMAPKFIPDKELIKASVENQIFPMALYAQYWLARRPQFCITGGHKTILYDKNGDLKNGWLNTQFAAQFSATSKCIYTFKQEDMDNIGTSFDFLLKFGLPLIKIVFPLLNPTYTLIEGGGEETIIIFNSN